MSRRSRRGACALAVLAGWLWPQISGAAEGGRQVAWMDPLPSVAGAGLWAGTSGVGFAYLAFGFDVPMGGFTFEAEGAAIYGHNVYSQPATRASTGASFAVGPLFSRSIGRGGFFHGPKFRGMSAWFFPTARRPGPISHQAIGLGYDLGYAWVLGQVYLASVIGMGLDVCSGCAEPIPFEGLVGEVIDDPSPPLTLTLHPNLNLNLLRVGVTW